MIKIRPRRRLDTFALALDAPLPILPTCAGMRLPWPSGSAVAPPEMKPAPVCVECGNPSNGGRLCPDCDPFAQE